MIQSYEARSRTFEAISVQQLRAEGQTHQEHHEYPFDDEGDSFFDAEEEEDN